MSQIQLNDEAMNLLLNKAIIDALGADGQQKIVTAAIKHLTTPVGGGGYGSRVATSPLQDIMNNATEAIARQVCREKVEADPDFKAKVEALYAEAASKLFGVETREKLVEKMAEKMGEALTGSR